MGECLEKRAQPRLKLRTDSQFCCNETTADLKAEASEAVPDANRCHDIVQPAAQAGSGGEGNHLAGRRAHIVADFETKFNAIVKLDPDPDCGIEYGK